MKAQDNLGTAALGNIMLQLAPPWRKVMLQFITKRTVLLLYEAPPPQDSNARHCCMIPVTLPVEPQANFTALEISQVWE